MIELTVHLNGDGCWQDLPEGFSNQAKNMSVAVLDKGLQSGRPSVCVRLDGEDGTIVLGETSARLYVSVARMIMSKYPDLFKD